MHITWTSWFTSLTIKVYYLDILDYKSHYKGTKLTLLFLSAELEMDDDNEINWKNQ
jgi:hypothetical protein